MLQFIPFALLLAGLMWVVAGGLNLLRLDKESEKEWEKAKKNAEKRNKKLKSSRDQMKKKFIIKAIVQLVLGVLFVIILLPQIRIGDAPDGDLRLAKSDGQNSDVYENEIKAYFEDSQYPGLAICIVDGDESYIFTSGFANLSDDKVVDETTIFEIGSNSKIFTGMMLSKSINTGTLELDQRVASIIDEVNIDGSVFKEMTLEELTTHTSGLSRMPNGINFSVNTLFSGLVGGNPYSNATIDNVIKAMKNTSIDEGKEWVYSNYGVGILGMCLSKANSGSYEETLQEMISRPLGMTNTSTLYYEEKSDMYAEGLRSYYKLGNFGIGMRNQPWDMKEGIVAAGGIRSNAEDMLVLLKVITEGETPYILSSMEPIKEIDESMSMGMNWIIDTLDSGETIIWHNGQTGGFNSYIGIIKGENKGVFVVSNSVIDVQELAYMILTE